LLHPLAPCAADFRHKSYHPYLEKNKQRVREDEAKAAAEEEARERERIDAENKNRLDALRRKAGSPGIEDPSDAPGVSGASGVASGTAQTSTADEDAGDLPSSSAFKQLEGGNLMERHRKAKARAEKEERRRKERLDFDFPSETARKEKRRAEKDGVQGTAAGPGRMANTASGFDQPSSGGVGSDGQSMWTSGGHLNLFADLERVSRSSLLSRTEISLAVGAENGRRIRKNNEHPSPRVQLTAGRGERNRRSQYRHVP